MRDLIELADAAFDADTCWQCDGEGYTYGCGWDWQCDTYDEGEGTCLCTRHCEVCNPRKPTEDDLKLREVLADSLRAIAGEGE